MNRGILLFYTAFSFMTLYYFITVIRVFLGGTKDLKGFKELNTEQKIEFYIHLIGSSALMICIILVICGIIPFEL